MRNPILNIIIIALLTILGLGIWFFVDFSKKSYDNMSSRDANQARQIDSSSVNFRDEQELTISDLPAESRYKVYSPREFQQQNFNRRVLYFYAEWCPTCRPADRNFIEQYQRIPEDVVVFRVNYNDNNTTQEDRDIARLYDVTVQHTFVQVGENGEVLIRWIGGSLQELVRNIVLQ
jgi:thioredoxin 1